MRSTTRLQGPVRGLQWLWSTSDSLQRKKLFVTKHGSTKQLGNINIDEVNDAPP